MTTRFLRLDQQEVTGMEISDTALRFITLAQHHDMVLPGHYAELSLPEGCLDNGRVINKSRLISFLKTFKKAHKVDQVNLVLASSQIQTITLSVKGAAQLYIKEAIEKEFAAPAKDILYDYHAVGGDATVTTYQVTALPKEVSQEFLRCFNAAGITIASVESVGHALSRAILPQTFHRTAMIVNIDTAVTSITLIVNGKVSQTTMFAFGDKSFTDAIAEGLSMTAEEAHTVKRSQGLHVRKNRSVFDAVTDDCVALVRQINDIYVHWRNAHKALPQLEMVYLTGAGSNLRGLDEYIAVGLRVPVTEANVWANCLSFDDHIPTLPQTDAVRYGAAIGAALTSNDTINLLPVDHKKSLHRRHIMSVSAKIALSFILGVGVGFLVAKMLAIPTIHDQVVALLHKIPARW